MKLLLKDTAQPKFKRVMKSKFLEIMERGPAPVPGRPAGGPGAVGGLLRNLESLIDDKWSLAVTLLNKLRDLDETHESADHFLEFHRPPEWKSSVNLETLAERICTFDLTRLMEGAYHEEHTQLVLDNRKFRTNVLKVFNEAAKEGASHIKTQVMAQLNVLLVKFKEKVVVEKANARAIRERNKALLQRATSKQDVEDMVKRVEPAIPPLERRLAAFFPAGACA
jgi:hypothetical protein